MQYSYDKAGRRLQMLPSGQQAVDYAYDAAGRLLEVRNAVSPLAAQDVVRLTYDNANRRASTRVQNLADLLNDNLPGDVMRALDVAECIKWCNDRGVDSTVRRHLRFTGMQSAEFRIALPKAGLQIVGLSNVLTTQPDRGVHQRGLLWLLERGMWSEDYEAVGSRLWTRLALAYGAPLESIESLPGLVFDAEEAEDERLFLTAVMLFQWDAVIVPDDARYIIQMSHDGYVNFTSRDRGTTQELESIATNWR